MTRVLFAVAFMLVLTVDLNADELPPSAAEIVKQLLEESDQVRATIVANRSGAIQKLQELQDNYTRELQLDEAVLIRETIRNIKAAGLKPLPDPAPLAELLGKNGETVRSIVKQLNEDSDRIRESIEREITGKRNIAIQKLQVLQDSFAREAKLDEAIAIRDEIRNIKCAALKPQPDPGSLTKYRGQLSKVLIFEVTGTAQGSIYGTDVYTDDSNLSTAAVHANVLKPGEKGIVKVTILPGQNDYRGTARNGLTSTPYGAYPGSFKVEDLFRRKPTAAKQ